MAPAILLDLNCTPLEDLAGRIVPGEGNSASFEGGDAGNSIAFEGGNAPGQDNGVNSIAAELNCTPPDDLDDRVIPGEVNFPTFEVGDVSNSVAFEGGNALAQDAGFNTVAAGAEPQIRLRKWLTDTQRYTVYTSLHAKSRNEKLPKNATKEVADLEVCD